MTSTVERTAAGVVITGFEYTYDDLSRIVEEKVFADSIKKCYTYDSVGRVIEMVVKNIGDDSAVEKKQHIRTTLTVS